MDHLARRQVKPKEMFDSIGVPTRYDVLGVGRKEVCSYGERSSGFTHQGGRHSGRRYIRWRVILAIRGEKVTKTVGRRFAQGRPPFAVQFEQAVALRGDRVAVERVNIPARVLVRNLEVGVLPLEQRGLPGRPMVRVEPVESRGDAPHPPSEFQPRHAGRASLRHRIGVAEGPS